MPAIGGYTLELYCDHPTNKHPYREFPHEYLDPESGASCRRSARKDGWLLDSDMTLCPKCNPRSRRHTAQPPSDTQER